MDRVSVLNVSWVIEDFDHIIVIVSVNFIVVSTLGHAQVNMNHQKDTK